jgi:hypothetical protein
MLDDMRFLINTVLSLPENPTEKELRKVHSTSAWIYNRTFNLPGFSPLAKRASPTAPEIMVFDSGGYPEVERVMMNDEVDLGAMHLSDPSSRRGSYHSIASRSSEKDPQQKSPQDPKQKQPEQNQSPQTSSESQPDFLYQSVRLAALMYSRAVMERRPFSSTVSEAEFLQLWNTMFRVPLPTWKGVLGVFNWIMLAIVPTASNTPHARFVKSMLTISMLQMSMENWELTNAAMKTALSLQRWLNQGVGRRVENTLGDEGSHPEMMGYGSSSSAAI